MPTPLRPARRRQLATLGVWAAVLLGIALRFATTSPLWLDEALTARIARMPVGDIASALRHDGHPPLYYWLLHWWMELVGSGNAATRSLSGVFSVLSLPLAWRLGDRVGGPRAARWTLVLVALSPFCVRYATEVRMYSLVMLLVLLLALALDGLLRRPSRTKAAWVALLAGLLLWTHYWSLYLLAVLGILLLVRWWRDPGSRRSSAWGIGSLVVGGLLFLPWLPVLLDQLAHTGTPWARPSRPTQVAQVTLADLGGGGFAEALLLGTLLAVFVVAAFAHVDRASTTPGEVKPLDLRVIAGVAGGTMVLGSSLAWILGSAYASRYGSVVAPLVLVVAAMGIISLRPTWLQVALVGSSIALALAGLGHNVRDQRTRADDIAHRIVREAAPGDLVVVCPDQLGPSLTRVLDQEHSELPVLRYPDLGDGHVVDWRDYEERMDAADPAAVARAIDRRAANHNVFVVWQGGYRTLVGQCEALIVHLSQLRGDPVEVKEYQGAFETANFERFG
jgi:uncharacterized membrane protein